MVLNFLVTTQSDISLIDTSDLKPNWKMPILSTNEDLSIYTDFNQLPITWAKYHSTENELNYIVLNNVLREGYNLWDINIETIDDDYGKFVYGYVLRYDAETETYSLTNYRFKSNYYFKYSNGKIDGYTIKSILVGCYGGSSVEKNNGTIISPRWANQNYGLKFNEFVTIFARTDFVRVASDKTFNVPSYYRSKLSNKCSDVYRGINETYIVKSKDRKALLLGPPNASNIKPLNYPIVQYPISSDIGDGNKLPKDEDINDLYIDFLEYEHTYQPNLPYQDLSIYGSINNHSYGAGFIREMFRQHLITTEKIESDEEDENDGKADEDFDDEVPISKDKTSDAIHTTKPHFDMSKALITMYSLTSEQMQNFAEDMWDLSTWESIQQTIQNSKPMDYIIGLKVYPSGLYQVGELEQVRLGSWLADTSGRKLTDRYSRFDCGSLSFDYYYGNYVDFNTKISIYLPFVGLRELSVQDCLGSNIHLFYDIDMLTGDCVAMLEFGRNQDGTELDSILYHFDGNMSSELPITSNSYSTFIANAIGGIATLGATLVNPMAGIAVGGMVNQVNSMVQPQPVNRVGNINGSKGILGVKTPYLIIEKPIRQRPTDYDKLLGNSSMKKLTVGSLKGYVQFENIELNIPNATEYEKDKIKSMLLSGIYIK